MHFAQLLSKRVQNRRDVVRVGRRRLDEIRIAFELDQSNMNGLGRAREHYVDFGSNGFIAEAPFVDWNSLSGPFYLFKGGEGESLRGTDGGAHRPLAARSAVIAHVALHHLIELGVILGDSKRASQYAVRASDAPGFEGALHNTVLGLFYRIRWADASANRIMAMHADLGRGLNTVDSLHCFEVYHRPAPMSVAFLAGLDAGFAPDAAGIIDEEGQLAHLMPPASGSSRDIGSSGALTFAILTAQILYSGILEIGSIARIVQLLAARSSGQ